MKPSWVTRVALALAWAPNLLLGLLCDRVSHESPQITAGTLS